MNYYKIILSSKNEVLIDEEDYNKFLQVSGTGNFVKVKQAVINPSFVIAILPVKEKIETSKSIKGYVDPERNVFVVTEESDLPALKDEFKPQTELN
jgi:hypothetical protein